MEISPQALLYKLRQGEQVSGRVFIVFGEEYFFRKQVVAAIEKCVFVDIPESDREISVFDNNTDLGEFAGVINTYPFFSGRSLVLMMDEKLWASDSKNKNEDEKGTKGEQDKLVDILTDIPEYCTVLINVKKVDKRRRAFKVLAKTACICECKEIKVENISTWLKTQAQQYNAYFDHGAMEMIAEYLAPMEKAPLELLSQEISKLALYASDRKTWTKEDVEEIFAALPGGAAFALNNLLGQGRLTEALRVLALEKKKGTSVLPLCGMLMSKIRQLLSYRELVDKGYNFHEIQKKVKYAGWLRNQAAHFKTAKLQKALLNLYNLNKNLRRGGRKYDRIEEILVELMSN